MVSWNKILQPILVALVNGVLDLLFPGLLPPPRPHPPRLFVPATAPNASPHNHRRLQPHRASLNIWVPVWPREHAINSNIHRCNCWNQRVAARVLEVPTPLQSGNEASEEGVISRWSEVQDRSSTPQWDSKHDRHWQACKSLLMGNDHPLCAGIHTIPTSADSKVPVAGRPNLTSIRATKQRSKCWSKLSTSCAAFRMSTDVSFRKFARGV